MQKNRDVIEHYFEEQEGQFVTPRIKHLFSNAIQSSFGCCRNTPRPSFVFAVVPAERPLELNSKGKLTSHNIFKGLQCKQS